MVYSPNTSNLPSGYTEVEYIESTGTQYIDTGFTLNQDTRMLLDFQYTAGYRLAGVETRSNNTAGARLSDAFRIGKNTNGNWYTSYGNDYEHSVTHDNNRHLFDLNKNVLSIDGNTIYALESATFTAFDSVYIFNINNNYFSSTSSAAVGKLYMAKLYDDGDLIRDFVPCIRNSDGKGGLYDIIGGQMHLVQMIILKSQKNNLHMI